MPERSPNLDMPYLLPGQSQKHVTHNEAVQQLDALVQLSVLALDATTPPAIPAPGECWGLGNGASGDWAGHDGEIALWVDTGWLFMIPREGWRAFDQSANAIRLYHGAAWGTPGDTTLGINASADATNRLTVKSDAVLFSHDDVTPGTGDMRLTLNKSGAGNTGSVLFQSGFSGRAEFGLAGTDDLHLKVSADGSAWRDALTVDRSNGYLSVGNGTPDAPLHLVRDDGSARLKVEELSPNTTARTVAEFINNGRPDLVFGNVSTASEWSIGAGGNLVFKSGPLGSPPSGKTTRLTVNGGNGDLVLAGAAVVAGHTVAGLPAAGPAGAIIFVSDETGGAVLAFSDGTNWRRSTDRAIVS